MRPASSSATSAGVSAWVSVDNQVPASSPEGTTDPFNSLPTIPRTIGPLSAERLVMEMGTAERAPFKVTVGDGEGQFRLRLRSR